MGTPHGTSTGWIQRFAEFAVDCVKRHSPRLKTTHRNNKLGGSTIQRRTKDFRSKDIVDVVVAHFAPSPAKSPPS